MYNPYKCTLSSLLFHFLFPRPTITPLSSSFFPFIYFITINVHQTPSLFFKFAYPTPWWQLSLCGLLFKEFFIIKPLKKDINKRERNETFFFWKFIIKEDGGMHKRCHFLIMIFREATKKHLNEKNKIKMNHGRLIKKL